VPRCPSRRRRNQPPCRSWQRRPRRRSSRPRHRLHYRRSGRSRGLRAPQRSGAPHRTSARQQPQLCWVGSTSRRQRAARLRGGRVLRSRHALRRRPDLRCRSYGLDRRHHRRSHQRAPPRSLPA
jgi:hypothetical protein